MTWTTPKGTVIWLKKVVTSWRVLVQRKDTELIEFYGGKHPTKEAAEKAARKLLEMDV